MRRFAAYFPLLLVAACANPTTDPEVEFGSGGTAAGGGVGTGATTGTGGLVSSGGSTGGSPSGGAAAGGSETGGAASGGAASGGSETGGGDSGGTGGAPLTGDCAGKESWDSWSFAGQDSTGEQVVHACTSNNSQCSTDAVKDEVWLWQCTESHVANCSGQAPGSTGSWAAVKTCNDAGMGGATN